MTTAKEAKKIKALIPAKKKKAKDEGVEGEVVEITCKEGQACKACQEGRICELLKDRFGRPTVMTEEVKGKLHEAFAMGCSNREACIYAGISEPTLDKYNKKDPEYKKRSEELKDTPVLHARSTIVKSVQSSPYYALKFLERRKSDEFSVRVRQTFDEPEPITPEEQEAIDDVIDDNL